MPTWESLALDIRYLLLCSFCAEIIADFKALGESVCNEVRPALEAGTVPTEQPPLEWPSTPPSLTSFLSAILTCREFNDTILNKIKFNGRSTGNILEGQQDENISELTNIVQDEGYPLEIGVYYQAAGCFWKNPHTTDCPYRIPDVFQLITRYSSQLLVPHLGPWLQHRAAKNRDTRSKTLRQVGMLFSRNGTEGALVSFMVVSKLQDFCELGTIDPTYNLNIHRSSRGKAEPRSLGETDVGMSPIGRWWVFQFPFLSRARQRDLKSEWILVNYEEERMYIGPNGSEALVWKGRNIWDMATWARLKTMKEIEDYRGGSTLTA